MLVGNNLRVLIPASVLLGGALITFADVLARLTIVPAELPVGLLTSSLGVPFFLWLILREKRKFAYD
jgi:iron complex transport system permease protein